VSDDKVRMIKTRAVLDPSSAPRMVGGKGVPAPSAVSSPAEMNPKQAELNALQAKLGDLSLLIPTVDDARVLAHLKDWHAVLTRTVATKTRALKRPPKPRESKYDRLRRESMERVLAKRAATS
jgi:hypothetical protein